MPLAPPNLDTRTFDDLLEEARLRIPRYTPEWTDFNDSDPGMALVQLFAWFTDLMLYQLNRVPERNYLKFLQLLNLEPRPARPATTYVTFTLRNGAASQPVPVRTRFDVSPAGGGNVLHFETTKAVDLVPYPLDAVQVFDGADYFDQSQANTNGTKTFRPLGWSPQPGSALYLGFRPPDGRPPTPAFPDHVVLRVYLPAAPPGAGPAYTTVPPPTPTRTQQTLVVEYRSKNDLPAGQTSGAPSRWRQLTLLLDETAALTREGNLTIRGPDSDILLTNEGKWTTDKQLRYWLRLRLADGVYPADKVPEIAFVRSNVVPVENLVTVSDEQVGVSDGATQGLNGEYRLKQRPVDPTSLVLQVQIAPNMGADTWTQVPDFLGSGRGDTHYTLDPGTGVIQFGNGINGHIPEPGAVITAQTYRAGGGAAGNVKAGQITAPPGTVSDVDAVTNPRDATGGSDEESLDDLKARAPRALRGDGRAVTADDYRRFAEEEPGVVKAVALSDRHPDYPGFPVRGAVTVVIVPAGDGAEPKPLPELRDAVVRRLEPVRVLTAEIFVADPRYRAIGVTAKVVPAPLASPLEVKEQLEKVLKDHFRPANWDFGAKFYPSALYRVLLDATDETTGSTLIAAVEDLQITVGGQPNEVGKRVDLGKDELPSCAAPAVVVVETGGA